MLAKVEDDVCCDRRTMLEHFKGRKKKKFVFVGGGGQWLEVIQLVNYLFIDISNNAFQSLSTSV